MNENKRKEKERKILDCVNEPYVNLWHLRELALSEYGFVNDELRQRAWPLLTGVDVTNIPNTFSKFIPNGTNIPCSEEMQQVHRDVIRIPTSTLITPSSQAQGDDVTEESFEMQRNRLEDIINITLQEGNGKLYYYQGFHDVATIFLNVLSNPTNNEVAVPAINGISIASSVLSKISQKHLNQYMEKDFNTLLSTMKITIVPMIHILDPILYNYLYKCGIFTNDIPFFTLSWIITWFSHDMNDDLDVVKRLFDVMISSHPIFIIYIIIAMLLHSYNRNLILSGVDVRSDGDDCFALMHNLLCSLPRQSCLDDGSVNVPIQELIDNAILFMRIIPPKHIVSTAQYYRNGILFKNNDISVTTLTMLQFPSINSKVISSEIPSDWYRYKRKLLCNKVFDLFGKQDDMTMSTETSTSTSLSSLRKGKTLIYSEDGSNVSISKNDDLSDASDYDYTLSVDYNTPFKNAITTSGYNESINKNSFILPILQKYSPSYYYYYYYALTFIKKRRLLSSTRNDNNTILMNVITTSTTAAIISIMTFYYYYNCQICNNISGSSTILIPATISTSMYSNNSLFMNFLFFTTTTTTTTLVSRWIWSWWR